MIMTIGRKQIWNESHISYLVAEWPWASNYLISMRLNSSPYRIQLKLIHVDMQHTFCNPCKIRSLYYWTILIHWSPFMYFKKLNTDPMRTTVLDSANIQRLIKQISALMIPKKVWLILHVSMSVCVVCVPLCWVWRVWESLYRWFILWAKSWKLDYLSPCGSDFWIHYLI